MTTVLEEDGIDVIGAEARPAALVVMAGQLRPDAVVLDRAQPASRPLGARVRAATPDTTIVFWARDEDVMEIVDPGTAAPRRILAPAPEELREALLQSHLNRALSLRPDGA
jgi:AmiR/NasT family two-component response regulator